MSGTRLRRSLARLALAASLLAPSVAHARNDRVPPTSAPATARTAKVADPLDSLARHEDRSLERQRASGEWSTGEIVVVVLLLIFLFPIGLIVLIILLIVKA
jgi:hypothetical protein